MSPTSFLIFRWQRGVSLEFGDVDVTMESNGEESIRFNSLSIKDIHASLDLRTHAQDQQQRFQAIRLRKYLYSKCDNIKD